MNIKNINKTEFCCDVSGIFKIIGGKWKVVLIKAIAESCPKRFGELRKEMENITQTTLTLQLRELERDGIICRKIYAESPPKVEYKLTEIGISLLPIITSLDDWWSSYKSCDLLNK